MLVLMKITYYSDKRATLRRLRLADRWTDLFDGTEFIGLRSSRQGMLEHPKT